jgi:hypothetical protein
MHIKHRIAVSILYSRITDFFAHAKKRHKKSITTERTTEATQFPNRELQSVKRLSPNQLDDYANKARLILIETAKKRTLITYDTLMYKLNCGPGRNLCGDIVRRVSEIELAEGRPKLSAVVIRSDTRMVGGGFFGLPSTPDSIKRSQLEEWKNPQLTTEEQEYWHSELRKVYDYWHPQFH